MVKKERLQNGSDRIDRSNGGERVILVQLHLRDPEQSADFQEFHELANSAGAEIVGTLTSSRDIPDSKYFIGSGKVQELQDLVASTNAELVIFDHSLTPGQERNLEKAIKCRVLDRTGLILDIFAQRARTFEGKLQVQLARLKHQSTRLIRGWTHLERQRGGIGLRGGPGETQLEVDRRLIRAKIKNITERLEQVRVQRAQGRRSRRKIDLPTVALVGYTNAGKSTLFNTLTGADVYVANKLFATLDPTLRSIELPILGRIVLADTVGFVSKLPHDLVEAFRATLEEVKDADLLLHIIDGHDESWRVRVGQVEEVLQQIGANAVPRIEVYNKIDLLPGGGKAHYESNPEGGIYRVYISATKRLGLELLEKAIIQRLSGEVQSGILLLPPDDVAAKLRAALYEMGVVTAEQQDSDGISEIHFSMPRLKWQQMCFQDPSIEKYLKSEN